MNSPESLSSRISAPHSNLRCELLERAHASVEPNWSAVAELLRKTFQGDNCCIVMQHGNAGNETVAHAGISSEWISLYEERFAAINPFLEEAGRRRPESGGAFVSTADHLIPYLQVRQTDFYKSFMTPLGVNDSVGALVFDEVKPIGHVIVRRKSGAIRYGEAEEARMRSITDILHAAMLRCRWMRLANSRLAALDQLTARSQGGLIILDERGDVLESEGAARALLQDDAPRIAEIFAKFQEDASQSRGRLEMPTDLPGSGASAGLDYEFRKVVIEGRIRVLCILGAQPAAVTDSVQLPINAHFTPRERDVLTLLSRGLDNLSIARSLGIGLYTTKDHVKAIFRKLSVRTRAEAVAVLSRGPAQN